MLPPAEPEPIRTGPAGATRTPVILLTGFLGSGKTTLLSKALRSSAMADTAVVINEAGDMGLDHLLVETVEDQLIELPSGCLCCVRRLDIATTLRDLLERRASGVVKPFSRIVIETSGLADPGPILYTLAADPMLGHEVSMQAVVTLVDAVNGASTLTRHPEARSQTTVADRIVVTKADLETPSPALFGMLHRLNAWADRCVVAPGDDVATLLFAPPPPLPHPSPAGSAEPVVHSDGIATLSLVLNRPPSRLAFATMLGRLAAERGEDLLRVKGLVAFTDRPNAIAVIHAVQHTISRPAWLDRWPDRDERSRLVFIVRNIAAADVLRRFAPADPAPWAALPPAFACLPVVVADPVSTSPRSLSCSTS